MTRRSLDDLRDEMRAVARGERAPPPRPPLRADHPSRGGHAVLTDANRELLHLIAQHHPASVGELAELAGRQQSNVSRSLQDMAFYGLVRLVREGRTVRPVAAKAVQYRYDVVNDREEIVAVE